MSFLNELKRRNVLRVGAAYVVGSWLLIQIAETIFPLFGYGDTPARMVVIVLAIAIIPSLIFSWAFEITPQGLKRDADVDRDLSITQTTGKKLDRIILVVLALALATFAFDKFVLDPVRDADELATATQEAHQEGRSEALADPFGKKSIAVLPFVNMSDDASNEYFSDGISEELLNLLTRIPQMRVIARTSSFSFKGKDVPIAEIAQSLNVAHVLEGSVRKSGNKVRITAQLIDARSDTHLWSETYDRTLDDIFAIQDEIAAIVVAKLKVTLLGPTPKIAGTNPAAYDLLLKARQLFRQFTPEALEQALDVYLQVLELDPDYAEAWIDLAELYFYGVSAAVMVLDDSFALGREAAESALAIDPDLAYAYVILSMIEVVHNRDLEAAVRHFIRAVELEPDNPKIFSGATELLTALDRPLDWLAIAKFDVSIDPVNDWKNLFLGWAYEEVDRFNEALLSLRIAQSLNPQLPIASYVIGVVLMREGKPGAALVEFNQEPHDSFRLAGQTLAHFALGQLAQSDAALAELIEKHGKIAALNIAEVLAFRKEVDRAFIWLDKAVQYNDTGLTAIKTFAFFENLHSDPRWLQILRRIGVAPEQIAAIELKYSLPQVMSETTDNKDHR